MHIKPPEKFYDPVVKYSFWAVFFVQLGLFGWYRPSDRGLIDRVPSIWDPEKFQHARVLVIGLGNNLIPSAGE